MIEIEQIHRMLQYTLLYKRVDRVTSDSSLRDFEFLRSVNWIKESASFKDRFGEESD